MNMNMIINMVVRSVMRRLINGGINAGFDAASNLGRKRPKQVSEIDDYGNVRHPGDAHSQDPDQAPRKLDAQQVNRQAQQAIRMARRAGR